MALFDHLDLSHRARLMALATERQVPAGTRLIRRGQRGGDVFRLLEGSLEVVDDRGGAEVVLSTLGPGSVVGEMAFLDDAPRSADVRAGTDCRITVWPGPALRDAIVSDPDLGRAFYRALALELADRVRSLGALAASGALGTVRAAAGGEHGIEGVVGDLQEAFIAVDAELRAGREREAARELQAAWDRFLEAGDRVFRGLSGEAGDRVGLELARTLHPYLVRTRTAELARQGDFAAWLAHVCAGRPAGTGAFGELLDRVVLRSPTAQALRRAPGLLVRCLAAELRPEEPARVLVLPVRPDGLVESVERALGACGGEVTAVGDDPTVLATLGAGMSVRPADVEVRTVRERLDRLASGQPGHALEDHDHLLLDGLIDLLPRRRVATLARLALDLLRPGGVAAFAVLGPSPDTFVFDHLLGYRALRRSSSEVGALLEELGFQMVDTSVRAGAMQVVRARAGEDR